MTKPFRSRTIWAIFPFLVVLPSACTWLDPLDDDYQLRPPGTATGGAGDGGAAAAGGAPSGGGGSGSAGGTGPRTVTFGERPTSTHDGVTYDTQLSRTNDTLNYGASMTGWADDSQNSERRVTLFRFDLSAIPQGATVEEVTLRLCTGDDAQYSDSVGTVRFYRLLQSWDEGDQKGAEGVANWNLRTTAEPWAEEGAGPGSHDGGTELGAFIGADVSTEYEVTLLTSAVQDWVDNPDSNFGVVAWTLSDDGTEMILSEHIAGGRRPELEVTYAP
ncbi:MAG: DNRLRE domain-containing protein [Deltaproteobacteria bacterium]|jgi:hypothetical protein|nr:DNRLRE domain-containing protein [Deltaproteobacteria bacterium]MBW2537559.1 DNRLRE domain-containing protein [Deltaproteobacteria bacterium]